MIKVEMPEYERIVHPKNDPISEEQQLWYQLLEQTSDIVHNAMVGFVDSFTGEYRPFRLSEFFGKLNGILERYVDDGCENRFLVDEFVHVAYLAQKALKHIVANPSTKIIHVDTKVHATKLKSSNIRTMNYLAKRSGQTVFEKIAPDNKILTNLTKFSVDTVENRQSLYLWDYLYNVLERKFRGSPCAHCARKDRECCQIAEKISGLLRLKTEIRKSDLFSVKKEKQSKPNNKLICDKYYKLVWDSSKLLNAAKGKTTDSWEFVKERYETLIVWFVIARLLSHDNVRIVDRVDKMNDNNKIFFESGDDITLIVDEGNNIKELIFREVDGKYVCRCVGYVVNMLSAPRFTEKEMSIGDIIEEFFREKAIEDELNKRLEESSETTEDISVETDGSEVEDITLTVDTTEEMEQSVQEYEEDTEEKLETVKVFVRKLAEYDEDVTKEMVDTLKEVIAKRTENQDE